MQRLSQTVIVRQLAERAAARVARKVITALQRLTECKLSGDDSRLENTWDEICAQVQGDESYAWDAYLDTVKAFLDTEVERLAAIEREAMWLQTEPGGDWLCTEEKERDPYPVCNDDIVEHVLHEGVLAEAGRWSNPRIRAYLDCSSARD